MTFLNSRSADASPQQAIRARRYQGLEQTRTECAIDLVVQVLIISAICGLLVWMSPGRNLLVLAGAWAAGAASWTLIEYCIHRFVLHGIQPWRTWHALHHRHPTRHVFAPTLLVTALFASLVFAPLIWIAGLWVACGLTLGILCGYLFYSLTHLAIHHSAAPRGWLEQRRRSHTEHHRRLDGVEPFGVTTSFWDHAFALHRRSRQGSSFPQ